MHSHDLANILLGKENLPIYYSSDDFVDIEIDNVFIRNSEFMTIYEVKNELPLRIVLE